MRISDWSSDVCSSDLILTPGKGQVRALICSGSNPMVSLPDQMRAFEALGSLDLLVSLDVEMSNTARMAHYVIPDKMSMETPGVTQFTESMKYYGIWTGGYEQPYRSEEHTSELQSLMRISYAVFCLKQK